MFFFGGQNSRQSGPCPSQAAGGTCWKNECKYSHSKEDMPICRRWQEGGCIGGRGNSCQLRHYYNEHDKVVTQAKRFQDSQGALSENVDFSSPYRVKVVKEVERQRMEEVDLDTGKRRSWIETKEFDVYDLTGDTPAKPKPPLLDKSNNRNLITNLAMSNKLAESSETPGTSTPVVNKVVWRSGDDRTCPVCQRQFKNSRGVKVHRASKNSNCKVGKENLENGTVSPIKAITQNDFQGQGPSQERRDESSMRTDSNQSESIILIGDTPEIPVSRRRSTRLAVR